MASKESPVEVAVVGVGRMGNHHARTLSQMDSARLVGVVDFDAERAHTVADSYGTKAYPDVDSLLQAHPGLKAAAVAVPTQHHLAAATTLMERGVSCLVEKPLAGTSAEANQLVQVAKKHGVCLQVGHTERFNPAVRAVAGMDLPARFIEIDRVSPMTFRSMDIGVVMDLMIHDLDIVLALARSPIRRLEAVGIAVMGEKEDICDARITFENGCVATITASRVALKTARTMRLFSEKAYVTLDYQKRSGLVVTRSANHEALQRVRHAVREGDDLSDLSYHDLIHVEKLEMDLPEAEHDQLTAQATAFLDAVCTGGAPAVTAKQGAAAVEAAERVIEAIKGHHWGGDTAEGILYPP